MESKSILVDTTEMIKKCVASWRQIVGPDDPNARRTRHVACSLSLSLWRDCRCLISRTSGASRATSRAIFLLRRLCAVFQLLILPSPYMGHSPIGLLSCPHRRRRNRSRRSPSKPDVRRFDTRVSGAQVFLAGHTENSCLLECSSEFPHATVLSA